MLKGAYLLLGFLPLLSTAVVAEEQGGTASVICPPLFQRVVVVPRDDGDRWGKMIARLQEPSEVREVSGRFFRQLSADDQARFRGMPSPALAFRHYLEWAHQQHLPQHDDHIGTYLNFLRSHHRNAWNDKQLELLADALRKFSDFTHRTQYQ